MSDSTPVTHSVDAEGVGWIVFDDPTGRANVFNPTTQAAFRAFMGDGWTEINPVIGTRKAADPKPRDFVLRDDEIVAIWNVCEGNDDFSRIVRLLILLGSRRQEIGGMRQSELRDLDGPAPTWELPASRAKKITRCSSKHLRKAPLPGQTLG